jgi:hypothetical protein
MDEGYSLGSLVLGGCLGAVEVEGVHHQECRRIPVKAEDLRE